MELGDVVSVCVCACMLGCVVSSLPDLASADRFCVQGDERQPVLFVLVPA